jgi:hypothetical protein
MMDDDFRARLSFSDQAKQTLSKRENWREALALPNGIVPCELNSVV